MITTSEWPGNGTWVLRVALVASIFVHVLVLFGAFLADQQLDFFRTHAVAQADPAPQPDEIVTISTARRYAPRATLEHGVPFSQPARSSLPHIAAPPPFSHAAIAAFQRDFARNVAQAGSQTTDRDPASAPKRYRIQLQGVLGHLRRGEGIYYPTKGWRSGGLDYYFVAYQFTYPDGKLESGDVPWPIHFPPDADPFVSLDSTLLQHTPMPGPSPGYVPPGDLGAALRGYFPTLHFEESDAQP